MLENSVTVSRDLEVVGTTVETLKHSYDTNGVCPVCDRVKPGYLKFSDNEIQDIFVAYLIDKWTWNMICERWPMARDTLSKILKRETYKHVDITWIEDKAKRLANED